MRESGGHLTHAALRALRQPVSPRRLASLAPLHPPAAMLTAGMRLGGYEIVGSLGVGAMGEVYRARDTRLRRDVALKLLSESVAADPERLARFQREAEVLAALNHPHIAQIYGFEEGMVAGLASARPVRALVMELVEGETLAQRIAEGPLALDEALAIARQIAEALEAAHAQGVVHRDLKPANIKVRPDDTVKVLDFGLAKAGDRPGEGHAGATHVIDRPPAGASQLPTTTSPGVLGHGLGQVQLQDDALVTGAGSLLGTAAYMSPEQAKGRPADKRSDIWAFGCVLYEMLTGQRAFPGDDIAEVLAAVLAREPDWTRLPPGLSPAVRQRLKRCLHRDPRQRLADAQDLRLALEGAFDAPAPAVTTTTSSRWTISTVWFVAGLLIASTVGAVLLRRQVSDASSLGVVRFSHLVTESDLAGRAIAAQQMTAISPNGRYLVYNTPEGLYLRTMDTLEARLLPGTDNALHPFFSPDSRYLAYLAPGELRRIALDGGTSTVISRLGGVDAVQGFGGASWDADDTILIARERGIERVSVRTGANELVVPVMPGEQLASPHLLPGGDLVLFTSTAAGDVTRWDEADIVGQSLRTGVRTVIWRGGSNARFVPPRHLVFAQRSDLFAILFDPARLVVRGQPVPVVNNVQRATLVALGGGDSANYGVSTNGTLVFLAANPRLAQGGLFGVAHTLVWVDRSGREEATGAPTRAYLYPRLSPDGSRVAVDVRDADNDIWIWDSRRTTLTRFTFDRGFDRFPTWSPDGRRIAFSSQRDGSRGNLYWQSADGAGQPQRLFDEPTREMFPTAFTPDGRALLEYGEGDASPTTSDDVGVVRLAEGATGRTALLQTPASEQNPALSPDGRWLAYQSNESGRPEIYVRPFPEVDGGRWQVSSGGGTQPLWARNGRELFFRNGTAVMSAPIDDDPSFAARSPVQLFTGDFAVSLGGRNYDVSPDGRRFLMLKAPTAAGSAPPFEIVVVQRWVDELNRLAPAE